MAKINTGMKIIELSQIADNEQGWSTISVNTDLITTIRASDQGSVVSFGLNEITVLEDPESVKELIRIS
jgi:hypothetical protein